MSENEARTAADDSKAIDGLREDERDAVRRDLDRAIARLEHMRGQADLLTERLLDLEQSGSESDRLLEDLRTENARLAEEVARTRDDRDQLQSTLTEVMGSTSWKLTAPLRAAARRLRR